MTKIPTESENRQKKTIPHSGLSLLEVLISLTVLSLAIIPIMLNLSSSSQNSVGAYVNSSRSMLAKSILNEMDPEYPNFGLDTGSNGYNFTAMDTATYTESGRILPYYRRVATDNTLSSAMKRRVYISLYRNTTDALSAPYYQATEDVGVNELFIDVGASSARTDEMGRLWIPDAVYDSSKFVPGYVSGFGGATGSSADDVTNINATNDPIYQSYRDGADLRYGINVDPGNYVLKLYFEEFDNTVTGVAPNRRRADIAIGDAADFTTLPVKLSNYSPYEALTAYDKAQVLTFEISIATASATKSINIRVKSAAAGTDKTPRLSGISVHRM
ncbi:MAG TPA: malectin domain-containing carbohydrate-binding protein [Coleofasciculaceae cyanobacterium]|jgi:Tfp pilus assembly protein PilV